MVVASSVSCSCSVESGAVTGSVCSEEVSGEEVTRGHLELHNLSHVCVQELLLGLVASSRTPARAAAVPARKRGGSHRSVLYHGTKW